MTTKTRIAVGEKYKVQEIGYDRWSRALMRVDLPGPQWKILDDLGELSLLSPVLTYEEITQGRRKTNALIQYLVSLRKLGFLSWTKKGPANHYEFVMTEDLYEWLYGRREEKMRIWLESKEDAEAELEELVDYLAWIEAQIDGELDDWNR